MEKCCDVAFMISGICFTVKCHNDEACEEVHAPGSGYKPMLSYVVREKPTKHHLKHRQRAHLDQHTRRHQRVKGKVITLPFPLSLLCMFETGFIKHFVEKSENSI